MRNCGSPCRRPDRQGGLVLVASDEWQAADLESGIWNQTVRNFETSQLRNSPKLPNHPYLPYPTDRRSLSIEGLREWTAG